MFDNVFNKKGETVVKQTTGGVQHAMFRYRSDGFVHWLGRRLKLNKYLPKAPFHSSSFHFS